MNHLTTQAQTLQKTTVTYFFSLKENVIIIIIRFASTNWITDVNKLVLKTKAEYILFLAGELWYAWCPIRDWFY